MMNSIRMSALPYLINRRGPHGIDHWERVAENGAVLSRTSSAREHVVGWFAYLHDSKRENDGHDPEHGARAAEYAKKLRNLAFSMKDDAFELLLYALEMHDKGLTDDNPTIGACWDADRLDLPRVGIVPDPEYMSTAVGRYLAWQLQHKYGDM